MTKLLGIETELVPIKPFYFAPGSKSYEPGWKYGGLYGKTFVYKWPYFIQFWHHSPKTFITSLIYSALSLHMVKIYKF